MSEEKIEHDGLSDQFGARESHPSFGMIGIHRSESSHPQRLFGSPLGHRTLICISVKRAERRRSLHSDNLFAREELIEVVMSENQFAQFITAPNIGDGVPCTISRLEHKNVEDPPKDKEASRFREEVAQDVKDAAADLKVLLRKAEDILGMPGTVKSKDKEEMLALVRKVEQGVRANLPFILEQLQKRMDDVVASAKNEIDAFLANRIRQAGEKALGVDAKDAVTLGIAGPEHPTGVGDKSVQ